MAHSRDWSDIAPANSDDAGDGAQDFRQFRVDVNERITLDHWIANSAATGVTQDGYHKKVQMDNSSDVPEGKADAGILHVKDVANKAELHYMDEDNNDVQLTSGGVGVLGKITETGTGSNIMNMKVVPIGDWDMDASTTVTVSHGLGGNFKNIRSITGIIRNDGDTLYYPNSSSYVHSSDVNNGWMIGTILSTTVELTRRSGGLFDGTSYNSTSFNRGWITIWYTD